MAKKDIKTISEYLEINSLHDLFEDLLHKGHHCFLATEDREIPLELNTEIFIEPNERVCITIHHDKYKFNIFLNLKELPYIIDL